jgi:hypothetical protein
MFKTDDVVKARNRIQSVLIIQPKQDQKISRLLKMSDEI